MQIFLRTYTTQEVDDHGRFEFSFMALSASINAWLPIISVDGAHLKNKYFDTILSSCTLDENLQIVPLAFAIVDSKNNAHH